MFARTIARIETISMGEMVEVSVLCITYNQVDYIEDAVKSFLSQQTNFKYEIVIHDDASTDGTAEILEKYEQEHSGLIKVVCEKKNKYSQGISFWADMIKNHTQGKYIALCEGDDFWIDDNKLQCQYDAMEIHEECDMCACWGCTITEDGLCEISQIRPMFEDGILDVRNVILGGGMYVVTSGLFIRKDMYYDMMDMGFLDYAQQIRGALRGGIYYIDKKMAVYRRYSKGSWTNTVLMNDERRKKQWAKEVRMLESFDKNTGYKYHDVILEKLLSYIPFEEQLEKRKTDVFKVIENSIKPCYIWGYGRRGKSLERFLADNEIEIAGICDAINSDIGKVTICGNEIFSTEHVIKDAKTIFATSVYAYDDLIRSNSNNQIINFQEFMPNG